MMERTTDMDTNKTIDHSPPSRRRAGSKGDYKVLLDSTEQNQQYEFVKKTPFGEVILHYVRFTSFVLVYLYINGQTKACIAKRGCEKCGSLDYTIHVVAAQ